LKPKLSARGIVIAETECFLVGVKSAAEMFVVEHVVGLELAPL